MNTNDEGSRFSWRRLLRAVVATVAILAVVTLNVILFAQSWMLRVQASSVPDVPEYLMPGQPAPTSCEFQWRAYYPSSSYYCRTAVDGAMMFAEYGIKNGAITRVSFSVSNKTIGDLILQWGNPTGIRHYNWGVEVYW
jgi:hypothetical protein